MNEQVDHLNKQLRVLGFGESLEKELLFQLCFLPEQLTLRHIKKYGADIVAFSLLFERGSGGYQCKYFDASLQKQISFDDAGGYSDLCGSLDKMMSSIDWVRLSLLLTIEMAGEVEGIMHGLQELGENDEGKEFADRLRYKYWINTDLEHRIQLNQSLRNRFEVNQRFYFFEEESPITIDEAYRFLNNKWLERLMQLRKKQVEPAEESAEDAGALLPKRRGGRKK